MYIIAFVAMHVIFGLKYVLSVLIEDTPEWVEEDAEAVKHRVVQIEQDNTDKKLMHRLAPYYSPLNLVFEVLGK